MVGDYGVLNGQDIDWSGHDWRNSLRAGALALVPVVSLMFARRCFRRRCLPAAF